jgi:hypothetical protein
MPNYRRIARQDARKYGLDPGVFERQIQQESGFQTGRTSGAGARGIAQIMPATARGWGVNPDDPRAALDAAAQHMAAYVKQYGSIEDALVAYNAGPGRVGGPLPAETRQYLNIILGPDRDHGSSKTTARAPARAPAQPRGGGRTTTTTTTTTPGIDNRQARYNLVRSFLFGQNADPIAFATQFKQLQDVAPETATSIQQGAESVRDTGSRTTPTTGKHGSLVLELIHNDGGKGFGIKDGRVVDGASTFSSVWQGHGNHVHVAAGPHTIVSLGRLAQSMGLHVGENPHFGGVDPVHVPGSYHYKGEAIDVSGANHLMSRFAKAVERYNRTHQLPA